MTDKWCRRLCLLLVVMTAHPGSASDLAAMYPRSKLVGEEPRFKRRLVEIYDRGIAPVLTAREMRRLSRVEFHFPLIGEITGGPMDYYSGTSGSRPFLAMPVFSLLFLEDLCTAYAWLYTNGYSLETIDEYVTMLRYKKAEHFPRRRYPAPLKALQIPGNALSDKRVDELSLRLRNSAFAFILLHELGHILYQHRGYRGIPTKRTRGNESDSDRFAVDVLSRTKTIPMGAVLFFQAQAYYMPSKGQLQVEGKVKSEADWKRYRRTKLTHPLTADRLSKVATRLYKAARRYDSDSGAVAFISTRIEAIVEVLELEELQGCMAVVADRADLSTLAPRRPSKPITLLGKWCTDGD